jgi:hypothetical protein
MADKKETTASKKTVEKKETAASKQMVSKIQVDGPADVNNGASVLRFIRDGRKAPVEIIQGQVLTVGDNDEHDLTFDEAQRLLSYSRWNVKEVKDNA